MFCVQGEEIMAGIISSTLLRIRCVRQRVTLSNLEDLILWEVKDLFAVRFGAAISPGMVGAREMGPIP